MADKGGKHKIINRNQIYNILIVVSFLLVWEFLLSNPDNVSRLNEFIHNLIGWNPHFRAFSLMAWPKPSSIAKAFFVTPARRHGGPLYFWDQTQTTLSAVLLGFLVGNLFAMLMAVVFVYVHPVERAVMPLNLALRSIPLVAIIPLLLRIRYSIADLPAVQNSPILQPIFGTEQAMKMLIVVIIVFFPTLVNVYEGLRTIEPAALELMHTLSASEWYIFWNLRVPSALPLTFSALKISASASVGGVIAAEWLCSNKGLGFIMAMGSSSASLTTSDLWVAIIITTLLSFAMFWLVSGFEKVLIPWHESVIALQEAMKDHEQGEQFV